MEKTIVHPIRKDYISGMTYKAIAEKYKIDQRTAKRYAELNLPMSDLYNRPFSSVLDPFRPQIDRWLSENRIYASTIYDWLLAEGCSCSYSLVQRYVQRKIDEYEKMGCYNSSKRNRYLPSIPHILEKSKEEKTHVIDRKK